MTEFEWSDCKDPELMLRFLRGKASARKLRLIACACSRRIWSYLGETPAEIGLIERFVDGQVAEAEVITARSQLGALGGYSAAWAANNALHGVLDEDAQNGAEQAVPYSAGFQYFITVEQTDRFKPPLTEQELACLAKSAREDELCSQTVLLRDVFGNPFSPAAADASWLAWNDGAVVKIAQAIYEERAFDRLPILADALEDVGCDDADILNHCRSGGEHVRGCWVIDLLLGKK